MFFMGRNFVCALICTLKSKKHKKLFPKNLGFFQPLVKQPLSKRLQNRISHISSRKFPQPKISQKKIVYPDLS